jgi:serine/threonine-protein kinase
MPPKGRPSADVVTVPRNENRGASSIGELSSSALVEEIEAAERAPADGARTLVRQGQDAPTLLREPDAARTLVRQGQDAPTLLREPDAARTLVRQGQDPPTLLREPDAARTLGAPRKLAPWLTSLPIRPWMIVASIVVSLLLGVAFVMALLRFFWPSSEDEQAAASSSARVARAGPPESSAKVDSRPTHVDGLDAAAWRARLTTATERKEMIVGAKAVLALAQLDPKLLASAALRNDVVAVAAGIAFERNSETADRVFNMLANELGSDGPDILLDIVRSRVGTNAGRRATELLAQPDVMARATPAVRITFEFRRASCEIKRTLLERAVAEGDRRTLFEMQILKDVRCRNDSDPCCFQQDAAMAEAIQKLKARLSGSAEGL